MSKLKDITIIIPTHNRENYLSRILDYYKNYDIKLLIADSSEKKFTSSKLNKPNITYSYTPNLDPTTKWFKILELVNTPYLVYCADDDYIFVDEIENSIDFLDLNKDYVCIQGKIITYTNFTLSNKIEYNLSTTSRHTNFCNNNFEVTSDNQIDRLKECTYPYRHLSYSIHRYGNIYEIYELLKDIKERILVELALVIMSSINGKTKELDKYFHLREYIYNSSGSTDTPIISLIRNKNEDYIKVLEIISDFLIAKIDKPLSKKDSKDIIISIFESFLNFFKEYKEYKEIQYDSKLLENDPKLSKIYEQKPELKIVENIIKRYNISSGFDYILDIKKLKISTHLNLIQKQLKLIFDSALKNKKVIVYGAGEICKLIVYQYKIEYIVDKYSFNKSLNNIDVHPLEYLLTNHSYDSILISVLGREEYIIKELKNTYNIKKEIIEIKV